MQKHQRKETFQCTECGKLWTMPADPNTLGTYAPCSYCMSTLGSVKIEQDDLQQAQAYEENTRWLRPGEEEKNSATPTP